MSLESLFDLLECEPDADTSTGKPVALSIPLPVTMPTNQAANDQAHPHQGPDDGLVVQVDDLQEPTGLFDDLDDTGPQAPAMPLPSPVQAMPAVGAATGAPHTPNASERTATALPRVDWPAPGGGMSDVEIATMLARCNLFTRRGMAQHEADIQADRLLLRDRDMDDRRICLECQHLMTTPARRCTAAARGAFGPGVASDLQPVATLLQRCDAFVGVLR